MRLERDHNRCETENVSVFKFVMFSMQRQQEQQQQVVDPSIAHPYHVLENPDQVELPHTL